jgi:hypothetical protein
MIICSTLLPSRRPVNDRPPCTVLRLMPKSWIYMQVLIVIFTLAGIVIAITKLA